MKILPPEPPLHGYPWDYDEVEKEILLSIALCWDWWALRSSTRDYLSSEIDHFASHPSFFLHCQFFEWSEHWWILVSNKVSYDLAKIHNGLFKIRGLRGCLARLRVLGCPWLPREIRMVPPIRIVGVAIWSIAIGLKLSNNICLIAKHFSHNWHRRTLLYQVLKRLTYGTWYSLHWCFRMACTSRIFFISSSSNLLAIAATFAFILMSSLTAYIPA